MPEKRTSAALSQIRRRTDVSFAVPHRLRILGFVASCLLILAAGMSWLACKTGDQQSAEACGFEDSVDRVLDDETGGLLERATQEHVPTPVERRIVAVFWALVIHSEQAGSVHPGLLRGQFVESLSAMSAHYPSLTSGTCPALGTASQADSSYTCEDNCLLEWSAIIGKSATFPKEYWNDIQDQATAIADALTASMPSGTEPLPDGVVETAVSDEQAAALNDAVARKVAKAILKGALVAVGGSEVAALLAAGKFIKIIKQALTEAKQNYKECKGWQAANCSECASGEIDCPMGKACCDGACVDLATDNNHCGSCGNACPYDSLNMCESGQCIYCGFAGEPCCPSTDGVGHECWDHSACDPSKGCGPCGDWDSPCCLGKLCDSNLVCAATKFCSCGELGEPCCEQATTPPAELPGCNDGGCDTALDICVAECGLSGQPCCQNGNYEPFCQVGGIVSCIQPSNLCP